MSERSNRWHLALYLRLREDSICSMMDVAPEVLGNYSDHLVERARALDDFWRAVLNEPQDDETDADLYRACPFFHSLPSKSFSQDSAVRIVIRRIRSGRARIQGSWRAAEDARIRLFREQLRDQRVAKELTRRKRQASGRIRKTSQLIRRVLAP